VHEVIGPPASTRFGTVVMGGKSLDILIKLVFFVLEVGARTNAENDTLGGRLKGCGLRSGVGGVHDEG
jgi:hypothetical protein